MSDEHKQFVAGFAAALTSLVRNHGMPTVARYIAEDNGFVLSDFEDAGLEAFDIDALRTAFERAKDV